MAETRTYAYEGMFLFPQTVAADLQSAADHILEILSKGKPIFIEGRLKLDSWEDKDGQKRSKMRVVIDDFQFVEGRGGGGGGAGAGDEGGYAPSRSSGGGGGSRGGHSGIQEEEIPF